MITAWTSDDRKFCWNDDERVLVLGIGLGTRWTFDVCRADELSCYEWVMVTPYSLVTNQPDLIQIMRLDTTTSEKYLKLAREVP